MNMTMNLENRPQRKIKLINRDFQVGLMVKFFATNAGILTVFGGILFLFLRGEVESNLHSAHVTYKTVGAMLFPIILTSSLLILAILSVTTIYVILHASHRIAGPMYRFNQALVEMGGRNLKAMTKIRENDQLEIVPGDRITVTYEDPHPLTKEHRFSEAFLRATFHNGTLSACFVESDADASGERHPRYIPMRRFRPGSDTSAIASASNCAGWATPTATAGWRDSLKRSSDRSLCERPGAAACRRSATTKNCPSRPGAMRSATPSATIKW